VPLLFRLFGRGRAWLYFSVAAIIASVAFRVLAFARITSINNPSMYSMMMTMADSSCAHVYVITNICDGYNGLLYNS
jgi:hypothetical protein